MGARTTQWYPPITPTDLFTLYALYTDRLRPCPAQAFCYFFFFQLFLILDSHTTLNYLGAPGRGPRERTTQGVTP